MKFLTVKITQLNRISEYNMGDNKNDRWQFAAL